MSEIDARGKPCPQPVLLVKTVADAGGTTFSILVDNRAAVENVKRYGEKSGYDVRVEELQGYWCVSGHKKEAAGTRFLEARGEKTGSRPEVQVLPAKALVIQSEAVGHGDEKLGRQLTAILLNTLAANERRPETIVLLNAGVKLACEGSEVVDAFRDLEEKGVRVLACSTCLSYFNLNHALRVGRSTDAYEIVNIMLTNNTLFWG
jgi:selenium metabolism protein YedF